MVFPLVWVIFSIIVSGAVADKAKDKKECTEQLVGLATCLPYVEGEAKAPAPDCCSGLKQVLKSNKKCLCVIIEDRNDPDLGLAINVTLALGLPSACRAPANISQCPALLHLAPNSSDAQVFYQFANSSNTSVASSPTPAAVKGNSTSTATSANSKGTSDQVKSEGCCSGKRWLGLHVIVFRVALWFLASNSFM